MRLINKNKMFEFFLIISSLFFPSFSQIYAPMSTRTFEFIVEDICSYQKSSNDFIYVEPCEKDYSCEIITYTMSPTYPRIGVCTKNIQEDISFGSACEKDDDCDNNVKCLNKICSLEENDNAISINGEEYCPDNLIPILDIGVYKCEKRENNIMNGLCYLKTSSGEIKHAYPDYMKLCGEITLDKEENNYEQLKIAVNSLGSVDDGKFVYSEEACKSGFALKFYPDGKIVQTITNTYQQYLKCVKYNGIEYKKSGSCKIKYILNNQNLVYDVDKTDFITNKASYCSGFKLIETKLDLFKQYLSRITELGDECIKKKYYDEPFTCKDDELRKLFYFYGNIEKYLLYKNEDEIMEFILQNEYPSYKVQFNKTEGGSNYLNNKYISLLILLLLIF